MGLSLTETEKVISLSPYPRPEVLSGEEKGKACDELLKFLLREQGMIAAFSASFEKKRKLVRGYMNQRMPLPIPSDILKVQDELLWTETTERGIVPASALSFNELGIGLWEGDITRLKVDGIVNAANDTLLGCFLPEHNCIDNVIHSCAGMQLRDDCAKLMAAQGGEEESGEAKLTRAYNLPCKYVLHTVGPMVKREVTEEDRMRLRSSYISCLNLAEEKGLSSLAFCCIATGVFNFPFGEAAEIATGAVVNWKMRHKSKMKVLFCTFLPRDTQVYGEILKRL